VQKESDLQHKKSFPSLDEDPPAAGSRRVRDASAGGDEVAGVVANVEANEVCLENTLKPLLSEGQRGERV
jgi:hypothetical protein